MSAFKPIFLSSTLAKSHATSSICSSLHDCLSRSIVHFHNFPVVSSPPSEVGDLARVGYQITEFDYQDYHSMANKIATIKKNYESGSPLSIYRNDNDQAFQRENIAKAFAKMVLED